MVNESRPCGCAFHRGLTCAIPSDCMERSPDERAAYLASVNDGSAAAELLGRLRARFAEVDAAHARTVAHVYATGARPILGGSR